jgi:dephospho-CoA kinase
VADKVGASYYNEGDFLSEVRKIFGDEVFNPNGGVDKKRIAAIVFTDKEMLGRLNALVHPRVMADFDRFCQQHSDKPYVLFESAILYDYRLERFMDRVICVYLSLNERLARLRERDHADDAQLLARIHNQMPAEEMMRRADFVVLNYEGNPRSRQVEYIDRELRTKN